MKLLLLAVKTQTIKDLDNLFFSSKTSLSFSLGISVATSLKADA